MASSSLLFKTAASATSEPTLFVVVALTYGQGLFVARLTRAALLRTRLKHDSSGAILLEISQLRRRSCSNKNLGRSYEFGSKIAPRESSFKKQSVLNDAEVTTSNTYYSQLKYIAQKL